MNFKISKQQFDIVIIGSGGAGLMAAISAINSGCKKVAIISKVIPTSSHTVSAKGGINAALGNVSQDNWQWHAYDTLKGSDYLADCDAVEILCREAENSVIELEKMGMVFSRQKDGKISQRAYGGQTTNFGNGNSEGNLAYRACYSKDKTGHTILHTLYEQALKSGVKFFSEFFVSDLLMELQNQCHGCLAIDLNSGELVIFESSVTILATGGYSQIYQNTTSSLICSGDGSGLVFEAGLSLQDMEFVQFHPTGIFGLGFLITEAARGEGGYLLNGLGDRFMKNYAPKMMELASRDVISQAMATEIFEGRGCGAQKNFLHLDLRHLSNESLNEKLPGVVELIKNFGRLDAKKDLIPVSPSAHYTMGGVPTDLNCVVLDGKKEVFGLMAIGEAACVSVHGANRLGCNSLLDLIVFGKIAGKFASKFASKFAAEFTAKKVANFSNQNNNMASKIAQEKIEKLKNIFDFNKSCNLDLQELKLELQKNNEKNLAVFREEKMLKDGLKKTLELFEIFKNHKIHNQSLIWNEELVAYLELKNLFLNSLAANFSAINRTESRGAHYRSDFKNRDDKNFHAHSLVKVLSFEENKFEFSLKPIRTLATIPELNSQLQIRKY
jgi:succinate dehydrogenase / fumarate reductase flavoprotein subunit